MEDPLYRNQVLFVGRFRDCTTARFLCGDVAGKPAIQPRGDQIPAVLPFYQHDECKKEGPGEVGDEARDQKALGRRRRDPRARGPVRRGRRLHPRQAALPLPAHPIDAVRGQRGILHRAGGAAGPGSGRSTDRELWSARGAPAHRVPGARSLSAATTSPKRHPLTR